MKRNVLWKSSGIFEMKSLALFTTVSLCFGFDQLGCGFFKW